MDAVSQIKSKLDIVDVVGSYISLKKSGRNYKACCPFHGEKTASFMVSPELQIYKCFGCGVGGDIFNFVQEIEGVDFVQTLEQLAEKAGIELDTKDYDKTSLRKKQIFEINETTTYFYNHILDGKYGKEALEYLKKKRKLTKKTIDTFRIGYSPKSWDILFRYLTKKGYSPADLLEAGVIVKKNSGSGYIDKFRNRIIFPLVDISGKIVGFTARSLDSTEPKYLNSPETLIFHKNTYLYGLDKSKVDIKTLGAVFVEGQLDVISTHQAGIKNVVASSGTSVTTDQLSLLKRYTSDLSLCFDSDTAGIKAAYRTIDLAEKQNFNIKVVVLPDKFKDIDEVLQKDKELAKKILKNSVSAYDFFIADNLKKFDKNSAVGKKKIMENLKPLLSKIENSILLETYLKELSDELAIDFDTLEDIFKKNKKIEETEVMKEKEPLDGIKSNLETYFFAMLLKGEIDVIKAYLYNFDPKGWISSQIKNLLKILDEFIQKESKFEIEKFVKLLNEQDELFVRDLFLQEIAPKTKELEETFARIQKRSSKEIIKGLTEEIKLAEKQNDQTKIEELVKEFEKVKKDLL